MNVQEIVITCPCEKGSLFKTQLEDKRKKPVAFMLTEDERIVFVGLCSHCGNQVRWACSVLELLFQCPKKWEVH